MTQLHDKTQFFAASSDEEPDFFGVLRGAQAPILVALHGISRNAAEIAWRFADDPRFAECTVIAPLFAKARFGQYQQLTAGDGRVRSDVGLFALLDRLQNEHGIDTSRVRLFGFSGGAQMAHRIAMLYPHRVEAVLAVAAGWYLMPDPQLPYPYGLGGDSGVDHWSTEFLQVPMTVAVGTRDTRIDQWVRQDPVIGRQQGRTRLARARKWARAMGKLADECGCARRANFVALTGGSHDFSQCVRDAGLMDLAAHALCATQDRALVA
jgi:poly(3-hydroxybutyrate) depolymerase